MLEESGWTLTPDECQRLFVGKTLRDERATVEARTGRPLTDAWLQLFYQRRNRELDARVEVIAGAHAAVASGARPHAATHRLRVGRGPFQGGDAVAQGGPDGFLRRPRLQRPRDAALQTRARRVSGRRRAPERAGAPLPGDRGHAHGRDGGRCGRRHGLGLLPAAGAAARRCARRGPITCSVTWRICRGCLRRLEPAAAPARFAGTVAQAAPDKALARSPRAHAQTCPQKLGTRRWKAVLPRYLKPNRHHPSTDRA